MDTNLSPEVITDLIQLIKDNKFEVKKGALMLLLQFCTERPHRSHFEETEIIKLLLRNMLEEGLQTISLSNLINFSQDQIFVEQIYTLNGTERIVEHIKTIIKTHLIDNFTSEHLLTIELSLLVLSNVTQNDKGAAIFMSFNDEDKKGINFWLLFELYVAKKTSKIFKFFGNSMSNVSSNKEIREYLINPHFKMIERLMENLFSNAREIRINVLKTLRNLTFEYENKEFFSQIAESNIEVLDLLSKYITIGIKKQKFDIPFHEKVWNSFKCEPLDFEWKEFNYEEEIVLALDVFLVLTNVTDLDKKIKYNKDALALILESIRGDFKQSEIKDKIDVIACMFCQLNLSG